MHHETANTVGTPHLSLSYIHLPLSSSVANGMVFWPSVTSEILHMGKVLSFYGLNKQC